MKRQRLTPEQLREIEKKRKLREKSVINREVVTK